MDVSHFPYFDDEKQIRGFVVYARDITERKRTEEDLQRSQEAGHRIQQQLLDQRSREKERVESELEHLRAELVRATRLAAIGQISGSIAHELRNPLMSVGNAVYYLRKHGLANQAKATEFLEIIDQQTSCADQIITNLLEMTRSKEVLTNFVDLQELVSETLAQLPVVLCSAQAALRGAGICSMEENLIYSCQIIFLPDLFCQFPIVWRRAKRGQEY